MRPGEMEAKLILAAVAIQIAVALIIFPWKDIRSKTFKLFSLLASLQIITSVYLCGSLFLLNISQIFWFSAGYTTPHGIKGYFELPAILNLFFFPFIGTGLSLVVNKQEKKDSKADLLRVGSRLWVLTILHIINIFGVAWLIFAASTQ
jgi:hypothetical protein